MDQDPVAQMECDPRAGLADQAVVARGPAADGLVGQVYEIHLLMSE
jgi:hypothetical protein